MQCHRHFKYWSETNTRSCNLCANCHTPLADDEQKKMRYKHFVEREYRTEKLLVENTESCLHMIPWQTARRVSLESDDTEKYKRKRKS